MGKEMNAAAGRTGRSEQSACPAGVAWPGGSFGLDELRGQNA